MAMIQRQRPAPVQATAPVRRLRMTSMNNAATRFATAQTVRAQIDEQLKLISKAENEIDEAQTIIDKANVEVEKLMLSAKIETHSDGEYIAMIVDHWTRQSRKIDPAKFRNKVANAVFWDSISVSIEKAMHHMTEKELNTMSDIVPAEFKGKILKVKKVISKHNGK